MTTIEIENKLNQKFDNSESKAIIRHLQDAHIDPERVLERLFADEPVQYIAGFAWFYNRKFDVNTSTLIPRPETEELCELIIKNNNILHPTILEIGTGSGCIAITLAAEIQGSKIIATDIDEIALKTAKINAKKAGVDNQITFIQSDFLSEFPQTINVDIIVSNPPYISEMEKKNMQKNVLSFEPNSALFAPGNDPLIFYKRMAELIKLTSTSVVCWLELNASLSKETKEIFQPLTAEILTDISNKQRFLYIKKEG